MKKQKKKYHNIFTYGVFDLFHYGHLLALKEVAKLGHNLTIGVYTDSAATEFKRVPIIRQHERFKLIKELELGKVVYLNTFSPTVKELKKLHINLVAKAPGAGFDSDKTPDFGGIETLVIPYTDGISTSEIIKRLR